MGFDENERNRDFERFVAGTELRLRRALTASYGPVVGRDAAVDALSWAWEHWERLQAMDNPVGYLYRVGQTASARYLPARTTDGFPAAPPPSLPR